MRAFIAIDLPNEVREALAHRQRAIREVAEQRSRKAIRWTRPEGIHLTLKFLGEISEGKVADVANALRSLGDFDPFRLAIAGVGFFPSRGQPRILWAGLDAPGQLGELAARIESAMEPLGFEREARAFTPHLTLARINGRLNPAEVEAMLMAGGQNALGSESASTGERTDCSFEVSEFFLFESRLHPSGAEYRKVMRFPAPRENP